jgi:hypothetical protein
MREFVIFYSWQSDTPRKIGSDFIRRALENAAAALNDAGVGVHVRIDAGTEGVPGTPPVTDTILDKIRSCALFVGDVTFVGKVCNDDGAVVKKLPNSNVMAEFGYAMHAIGLRRILLVMNTALGDFKELPFDLGHLRKPVTFNAPANINDGPRRAERDRLTGLFIEYIKTAIAAAQAAPPTDLAMQARANGRLDELLSAAPLAGAPALVSFPRVALHIVPLATNNSPIPIDRAAAARPYLLPQDGVIHRFGADQSEWWSHAPTRLLRPHTNPVADWCARLFADGAIEASWNIGVRQEDDPEILADGCALESAVISWTARLLRALRALGFDQGCFAQVSLLGLEDVMLIGRSSPTRQFRVANLLLPAITLAPEPQDLALAFQPAFDRLWLAANLEKGSPCG